MKKVVIVEDDLDILDIISNVMEMNGFKVYSTNNGDSLNIITQLNPELVITDNWLPNQNGEELCRQLKANALTNHIKVLLISAAGSVGEIAERCGADGYLHKPFMFNDLLKLVEQKVA